MRDQIQSLQQASSVLEPTPNERDQFDSAVHDYAHQFIDSLPDRNAFELDEHMAAGILDLPLDGQPSDISEILSTLKNNLPNAGINPASGGHLGYIPGGGIYATALGDYLAATTNEYAGVFFAGPAAVRIENQLIRWLCNMVGYPGDSLGNLASGGSIANLIAFVTARDAKEITSDKVRRSVIYLTQQVHHCVHKAIRIGGLAEAIIREIPMDDRFRMDAKALQVTVDADVAQGLNPFLVVASAGTTDTGAMDPLNDIADICQHHDLWFHVDAAYGGFFILTELDSPDGTTVAETFKGIERSDSLAIDPHKGLFLSYGLGAVLIKNVQAQMNTHFYQANYMQDVVAVPDQPSPADLSPELTKHWRGLRMWLPLQLYGTAPFKAALEEKILLCRYFYEKIVEQGFDVGPFPELSVCTYRYVPAEGDANEFNARLVEHVQRDGRIFVSSTTIDGVFWIRLAVLCFRTHLKEIDLLLEILGEGVATLNEEFAEARN